MRKKISLIITLSILASNGISAYAASKFDETFFNLNNINYYDAHDAQCISGTNGSTNLVGNDNVEKIWNFLKSKGFSDEAAAGVLGNLHQESRMDPKLTEGGRVAEENELPKNGVGFGIIQWTFDDRQLPLVELAKSTNRNTTDLDLQLDYMWQELTTKYQGTLDKMKTAKTIEEATIIWHDTYEISADTRDEVITKRVKPAEEYYQQFKGKSSSSATNQESPSQIYTFIGDSLTVGVKQQLEATFPGSDIRAEVGQGVDWALNRISGTKDTVVINLGTNDLFANGKSLLEKLKDKKKVYLIDIYGMGGSADFESTNNNIRTIASQFSNVEVLSWKNFVDSNGGRDQYYTQESGGANYHMSESGKELYIKFLTEKLSGNSGGAGSDSCSGGKFSSSKEATSTTEDGFPIFLQTDPRWSNEVYAPQFGFTMEAAACGPTSFAMIMTAFGISANPLEIAKKANDLGEVVKGGALGTQAVTLAKEYGLKAEQIQWSVEEINKRLDQGQLIWAGGSGMEPPFTTGGHMVVIRKKTASGKWLIANPYDYPGFGISQEKLDPMYEWNPSDVVGNMNMATAVWK